MTDQTIPAPTLLEARPGSLEDWATREPHRIAQVEDRQEFTYGQINNAADRLATGLLAAGVERGDIVVVRCQIRSEWTIIDAALTKLGCPNLGLNWRLTPAEVTYILSNSGASALFCDDADPRGLIAAFNAHPLKVAVSIDVDAPGFVRYANLLDSRREHHVSAGLPQVATYTSGTTGLPKGVIRRPNAPADVLKEYVGAIREKDHLGPGHVVLQTLPYSHGSGPRITQDALTAGAKLILMRRFDPLRALELINEYGVTHWTAVPTMFKRLASLPTEVLEANRPTTLKFMETGGAAVPTEVIRWATGYLGEVVGEGYGATEVGLVSYATPSERSARPGTCGRPYKHVAVSMRDDEGAIQSNGETGHIWVRTPVTISNYHNGPRLDPEVLDDQGFFRTGDVGHLDADGYLYITDRAKDMIISGGVNIYPAEIEAALIQHPAVQDAAVIGVPDDEFGEQVKAFIELRLGATADTGDIADFVAPLLASYKRPKSIEILDELPRNLMGKTLKRELRDPYWAGRDRRI